MSRPRQRRPRKCRQLETRGCAGRPPQPKVIKLLEKNRVVGAAIKEAKRFSGAKKCSFEFLNFEQPPQFEAGTTVDFAVKTDCTGDEASGIVDVEGVRSSDAPSGLEQIEKLALHFAG